jgi:hypothetical protein
VQKIDGVLHKEGMQQLCGAAIKAVSPTIKGRQILAGAVAAAAVAAAVSC